MEKRKYVTISPSYDLYKIEEGGGTKEQLRSLAFIECMRSMALNILAAEGVPKSMEIEVVEEKERWDYQLRLIVKIPL